MEKYKSENLNYIYYKKFFNKTDSKFLLSNILHETNWQHDSIIFFGKEHKLPRLTSFYADLGISYSYSGIKMRTNPWTNSLSKIKNKIENFSGCKFNSVLINRYRNGHDYHGYHSDNESCLGDNINIASVSFGAERDFNFKLKNSTKNKVKSLKLNDGSLLLMKHPTQLFWLHSLPKRLKIESERINLTFRFIKNCNIM